MAPRIYNSPAPEVPVVNRSVISHLFAHQSHPDNLTAFVDAHSGTRIARGHFKTLVLQFAHGLRYHPQVLSRTGDTVMIYSHNSLGFILVAYGALAAGLRCTLANNAYTQHELKYQYQDSAAKFIVTTEEGLPTVFEMFRDLGLNEAESLRRIILIGRSLVWAGGPKEELSSVKPFLGLRIEDLLQTGSLSREEQLDGTETALLCYSSGTTGRPKGVETTHQNLTTVLDIVRTSFYAMQPTKDRMLGILPFYHIYGAVKVMFYPFLAGVDCVIQQRFDPDQFCANIERYSITVSLIVPPVLVVLARHPAVEKYNLNSLVILFSGAAPLGASLVKEVRERFASRGNKDILLLQGYGLTETSPSSHLLPAPDGYRKVGSIGILLSTLSARLVLDDDGEVDAEPGQPGELWLRGPTIMKGYLNNPAATSASITPDGWFKTGDIARIDADGYYYIVDRKKELIKYKGFQVPPAELESVLLTHPDVADVAVIGVESVEEATELPRAYVVHARPQAVNSLDSKTKFSQEVQAWIQGKVAKHKYLRGGVVLIDIIPKSAAGKILRRELREAAKRERELIRAKL